MARHSWDDVIQRGVPLRLSGTDGALIAEVRITAIEGGLVSTSPVPGLRNGDAVQLERRRSGDARYWTQAKVADSTSEALYLQIDDAWERDQRRSDVRIRLFDTVATVEDASDGSGIVAEAALLDISAGGLSAKLPEELAPGRALRFRFVLPVEQEFDLVALVVRRIGGHARAVRLAFQFAPGADPQRDRIREWVLREGVRRKRWKWHEE